MTLNAKKRSRPAPPRLPVPHPHSLSSSVHALGPPCAAPTHHCVKIQRSPLAPARHFMTMVCNRMRLPSKVTTLTMYMSKQRPPLCTRNVGQRQARGEDEQVGKVAVRWENQKEGVWYAPCAQHSTSPTYRRRIWTQMRCFTPKNVQEY